MESSSKTFSVSLSKQLGFNFSTYSVRDAINRKDLGTKYVDTLSVANIPTHSVVVYVLKGLKKRKLEIEWFNYALWFLII